MLNLYRYILCCFTLALLATANLSSQIYPVVFSEVLYDSPIREDERISATSYRNGEYIEFYNPTVFDIDISGWTVRDDNTRFSFPPQTIIYAQKTLVLAYRYPFSAFKLQDMFSSINRLMFSNNIIYQDVIKLNNGGECLSLTNKAGKLIDKMCYGSSDWGLSANNGFKSNSIDVNNLNTLHRTAIYTSTQGITYFADNWKEGPPTPCLAYQLANYVIIEPLLNEFTNVYSEIDTSLPVGSLPGYAAISPTGAATYQIPIDCPPGTNGIQPNLSVVYNSQGVAGILGLGWDVAGLSTISRSPRNMFYDGENGTTIAFDNTDCLTLDGQRLILLSGDDFTNGAEYATEFEDYSRILFINGSFVVHTKEGVTLEYGKTSNSKISDYYDSNKVIGWKISRMTDVFGNSMEFKYNNTGQYIDKIEYLGTTNNYKNSIKFNYYPRPNTRYIVPEKKFCINGFWIIQDKILDNITISHENNIVKTYSFNYIQSDRDLRLNTVATFTPQNKKIAESKINWGKENNSIQLVTLGKSDDPKLNTALNSSLYSGDIDGDGYIDKIEMWLGSVVEQGYLRIILKNKTLNLLRFDSNFIYEEFSLVDKTDFFNPKIVIGDINLDGKDDLILVEKRGISIYTYSNNAESIELTSYYQFNNIKDIWRYCDQVDYKVTLLNYNDDEFPDIVIMPIFKEYTNISPTILLDFDHSGYIFYGSNNYVSQTERFIISNKSSVSVLDGQQIQGDFNADGKVDFIQFTTNNSEVFTNNSISIIDSKAWSKHLFHKPWFANHVALYNNIIPIDINNDGLTDLLVQANDNKNNSTRYGWFLLTNSGGYDVEPTKSDLPQLHRMNNININEHCIASPIDYNGDGAVDIVLADETFKNGKFTHTTWYFYKNVNGRFVADGTKTVYERLSKMNPIAIDINNDGVQDLVFRSGSNYRALTIPNASDRYRVASISTNSGQSDSFFYSMVTFDRSDSEVKDVININKPITITGAHTDKNGATTTYEYGRPKAHLKGKGFLGFETISATDTRAGIKTKSTYGVNTSYYGLELKRQEVFASNTLLSLSIQENRVVDGNSTVNPIAKGKTGTNRFMPYVSSSTSTDYVNGTSKTITNAEFDALWNVTKQIESMGDATKITETTYIKRNGKGVAYLPQTIKVTQQRSGVPDIVSQTNYLNYNVAGQVGKVITYPDTDGQVTTEYTYYPQGSLKDKKVTPAGLQSQTTTYGYDAFFRLCTSVSSPLGFTESTTYDFATGNVLKKTDAYGFETEYVYDEFGRLTKEKLPNGEEIHYSSEWTTLNNAIYKRTVRGTKNKSTTSTYFDKHGREVYSEQTGWKGRKLISSKTYNSRGLLAKATLPQYDDEVALYTEFEYNDILGRVTKELFFDGKQTLATQYAYSQGKTTITAPEAAQKKTETRDKHGLVVERTDAGGTISYSYNAAGQPISITSNGSKTEIEYDAYGNQKLLKDPNAGNISFTYYAGGLLKSQTNAKGDVTVMQYDQYGRIDTKTITENASNKTTTTKHIYVPSGNGVGQIKSIGLYGQNFLKHSQEFKYNNKHQLISVTDKYDGQTVTFSNTYDDLWRPLTSTSPSGLTTTNQYNDYGDLEKILSGNTVIWQGNEQNSKGQFTNYTLGNGLVTKRTFSDRGELESILTGSPISSTLIQNNSYTYYAQSGNLHTRTDLKNNRSELFEYDVLDRLTKAYLNNGLIHHMTYYPNGNIKTKSDVGTYRYDTPRPHAISGIDNVGAGVTNQKQFIKYTAFNKVSDIMQGADEQSINRAYYIYYGLDEQRIKTIYYDLDISGHIKIRYYFGTYEKEIDEFGNITETDYLYTPAGLTAMRRKTSSGAGLYYIHTDLLGSIERITNTTGQIVSEYTYTPWGGRILLSGVNITDRGYTGHEHLNPFGDDSNGGFCLINMNGRIYDPVLARFLSPDPYVQAPDFTQSFNRYAYGWNNPFKYTDPSGNSIVAAILIGGGINLFTQIMLGNVSNVGDAIMAFGIGGLSGLAGAGIGQAVSSALGGSIGAIGGALSGAAGGGAGSFIGGSGNAWFNGANFRDGLFKGLKSAGAGALSGGIFGGISGGIYSLKHGGDFWTGEGATFNCMLHPEPYNMVKVGKDMEYNYKYAKGFSDEHFGTIKKLDNLYADGRIPKKGYRKNGDLVFDLEGAHVGAVTEFNGIGKGSNVYLFKAAFTSKERLYLVMGHEYLHVYFNANGYSRSHRAKERVSYKWNIDQAKAWGLSTTYYEAMYKSYYRKDLYPILDYEKAGFFILSKRPW